MTTPLSHRLACILGGTLALAMPALADVTTLTASDQAQLASTSPAPLLFPITRSGDTWQRARLAP